MSATPTPFEAQAYRDPTGSSAYIRVRVPDGPRPDGSILVYLPNGTGLVVNSNQLLHLDGGPNWPSEADGRTSAARPSVAGAGPGDGTASAACGRTAALAYVLGQRTGAMIIGLILAASAELGFAR